MKILGEVQVDGRSYAVIDSAGAYVNGMFSRYILTPLSCINRKMENPVEVVKDEVCSVTPI